MASLRVTADVVVAGDGVAYLAAEEFVDGHAGALAFDVPKGHVHAAENVVVDGAIAPVGAEMAALPEVFDLLGVLADEVRGEMLFESGDDGVGLEVVAGRADAVEAGFAGDDLDEDPAIAAARAGGDDFDVLDGKRREAFSGLSKKGRGPEGF